MNRIPEFLDGATNVYRTKEYIVKQIISIRYDAEENNAVISQDTYYRRTEKHDAEYEIAFCMHKHIDGKRLPTTMYARTYID